MQSQQKLKSMLTLMSELCRLLKKENTLLKRQRQEECKALFEQKNKLSLAYEEAFKSLSGHAEIFARLSDGQKATLRKAATTLDSLTAENAHLLKINIDATNRLLNAIVNDIKDQAQNTPLYTKQGNMNTDKGNPAALSFNQVL